MDPVHRGPPADIEMGSLHRPLLPEGGAASPGREPAAPKSGSLQQASDLYQRVVQQVANTSWSTVAKTALIGGLLVGASAVGASVGAVLPRQAGGGGRPRGPLPVPGLPEGAGAPPSRLPVNSRLSGLASAAQLVDLSGTVLGDVTSATASALFSAAGPSPLDVAQWANLPDIVLRYGQVGVASMAAVAAVAGQAPQAIEHQIRQVNPDEAIGYRQFDVQLYRRTEGTPSRFEAVRVRVNDGDIPFDAASGTGWSWLITHAVAKLHATVDADSAAPRSGTPQRLPGDQRDALALRRWALETVVGGSVHIESLDALDVVRVLGAHVDPDHKVDIDDAGRELAAERNVDSDTAEFAREAAAQRRGDARAGRLAVAALRDKTDNLPALIERLGASDTLALVNFHQAIDLKYLFDLHPSSRQLGDGTRLKLQKGEDGAQNAFTALEVQHPRRGGALLRLGPLYAYRVVRADDDGVVLQRTARWDRDAGSQALDVKLSYEAFTSLAAELTTVRRPQQADAP